jgi:hypothetical protein
VRGPARGKVHPQSWNGESEIITCGATPEQLCRLRALAGASPAKKQKIQQYLKGIGYEQISFLRDDEAKSLLKELDVSEARSEEAPPVESPFANSEVLEDLIDCPITGDRPSISRYCLTACQEEREPASKLGVRDRWLSRVYMPSWATLKLNQMYEAMDVLQRHIAKIEDAVFFHTAILFNLVTDLIFVADSGANSAANREEIAKACGKYLLATRMSSVSEIKEDVLTRSGRYRVIAENLHAKEVVVGDGELRRRYIL